MPELHYNFPNERPFNCMLHQPHSQVYLRTKRSQWRPGISRAPHWIQQLALGPPATLFSRYWTGWAGTLPAPTVHFSKCHAIMFSAAWPPSDLIYTARTCHTLLKPGLLWGFTALPPFPEGSVNLWRSSLSPAPIVLCGWFLKIILDPSCQLALTRFLCRTKWMYVNREHSFQGYMWHHHRIQRPYKKGS